MLWDENPVAEAVRTTATPC